MQNFAQISVIHIFQTMEIHPERVLFFIFRMLFHWNKNMFSHCSGKTTTKTPPMSFSECGSVIHLHYRKLTAGSHENHPTEKGKSNNLHKGKTHKGTLNNKAHTLYRC